MKPINHQINEFDVGPDATPEQAKQMAEILTAAGYPTEYISTQGAESEELADSEEPDAEIPEEVWAKALEQLDPA